MAATIFFALLTIHNHLASPLTNPEPRLTHGTLSPDVWPSSIATSHTTSFRITAPNSKDGVQGSVKYSSYLLGTRRPVTFFFTCSDTRDAAAATSGLDLVSVTVKRHALVPAEKGLLCKVMAYDVYELVDELVN